MSPRDSAGIALKDYGTQCICGFYRERPHDPSSATEACVNRSCYECPGYDESEQALAQERFRRNGWDCPGCQMLLVVWRAGRYVLKMDGTLETDGKPVCLNVGCERSPYRQESRPSDDLTVVDTLI